MGKLKILNNRELKKTSNLIFMFTFFILIIIVLFTVIMFAITHFW